MKCQCSKRVWFVLLISSFCTANVLAVDFPGPDGDLYAGFAIGYDFEDAHTVFADCVSGCDDDIWARPIGFNFVYRGVSYSTVYVSVNGYISFTDSGHSYNNTTIPNAGGPPDMIAVLWDDLMIYPSDGGMWDELLGTAPNRQYIVQWWMISERQNEQSSMSFAIILHEGSNAIEFLYYDMQQTPMDVTIGIENASQTDGILGYYEGVSHGSFGGLPSSSSAYQFQPAPNLTYYQPPGWHSPIVPRTTNDTTWFYAPLPPILYGWDIGGSTWCSLAGCENGGYPAPAVISTSLYLDGTLAFIFYTYGLPANSDYAWFDYSILVPGGRHTLMSIVDERTWVPESDETDNVYQEQFVWSPYPLSDGVTHYCPNDAPYGFGPGGIMNVDGYQFACDYYWMAVGLRFMGPADLDLHLYNDYADSLNGFSTVLESSYYSPQDIDFIAIDGNRIGPVNHQVGVNDWSEMGNSENYQVQYDIAEVTWSYSGLEEVVFGPYSFTSDDLLKCHEISWTATEAAWITCINETDGDLDMRLFGSEVDDPYMARAHAQGYIYDYGAGLDDYCEIPVISQAYYGLVVTNETGVSGDYYIRIGPNQFTPTPTATLTHTSTPTLTPTSTRTSTPTLTPTNTPTMTPTISPTLTPTNTQTNTPTLTPTNTPTLTPTNTPTLTPTDSPTAECINNGDVNLSGSITAGDAQLAFLITLGFYAPTYQEECAADCNGDGNVTAGDAQAIFLTTLGLGACVDPL